MLVHDEEPADRLDRLQDLVPLVVDGFGDFAARIGHVRQVAVGIVLILRNRRRVSRSAPVRIGIGFLGQPIERVVVIGRHLAAIGHSVKIIAAIIPIAGCDRLAGAVAGSNAVYEAVAGAGVVIFGLAITRRRDVLQQSGRNAVGDAARRDGGVIVRGGDVVGLRRICGAIVVANNLGHAECIAVGRIDVVPNSGVA